MQKGRMAKSRGTFGCLLRYLRLQYQYLILQARAPSKYESNDDMTDLRLV
jgi:hypothetical protein